MKVTIANTVPRRDTDGNIIDAHGGPMLERFGDRYFLFGVRYADTTGSTDEQGKTHHYYVSYSSSDLQHWTFHGKLLPDAPMGAYFRPHVVYSPKVNKYVLWYHYFERHGPVSGTSEALRGIALADRPEGPYTVEKLPVRMAQHRPGDHDLFVDDDGTCYQVYTSHEKHFAIYVERLTDDYLDTTGECRLIRAPEGDNPYGGWEAPAMFKREGWYYFIFGTLCNRGAKGTDALVYRSEKPMGPFEFLGNVNRNEQGEIIIKAQQCHVSPIETREGTVYVWSGDQWRSAEQLGHSLQPWFPLHFDSEGRVERFVQLDKWEVELA